MPAFLPARKYTRNGIQYQISESGGETFIADSAKVLSGYSAISHFHFKDRFPQNDGILVLDCESSMDFDTIINALKKSRPRVLAGTSSLAARLAEIYGLAPCAQIRLDGREGILSLQSLTWEEI